MSKVKLLITSALVLSLIPTTLPNAKAVSGAVTPSTTERVARPTSPMAATFSATLSPAKDNTLYEELDGALSNGAGQYFFAGNTAQATNIIRRGLIAFDVAATVPRAATIVSATLHLTMSQTVAGPQPVRLHRVTADWGEGTSNGGGGGGGGAAATPGDATWVHRAYSSTFWTSAGGDFVITASATTTVGGVGGYTWSATGVVSDVQGWLAAPATNYGWLLLGNENEQKTAKRFNTKEHPTPSARPVLVVTYTVPYAIYVPIVVSQTVQ